MREIDKFFKYAAILTSIVSAVMIFWHWNDHEVSAWIVAFTGWMNYTLDLIKEDRDEHV